MSQKATAAHRDRQVIARFWAKVSKSEPDECWLWTASKRNKGYGAFAYTTGGILVQDRAHRFSYVLHHGDIPDGLHVLHNCPDGDNPACVNPVHLWLGTKADNNADMRAKGRSVPGGTHCGIGKYERGERHHSAKMTTEAVLALRADRLLGMSFSELGRKYGINQSAAYKIATGLHWRHVS